MEEPRSFVFETVSELSDIQQIEDDQQHEIRRFLSSFSSLLLFLQYFGLLVGQGLDLGAWGKAFSWLDSLSIIVNFSIDETILFITAGFIISLPIVLVIALKYIIRLDNDSELSFNPVYDQVILVSPLALILFLIISLPITLTIQPATFPLVFIFCCYYMLFWILYFTVKRVLKKVDAVLTLKTFILLLYTPIASFIPFFGYSGSLRDGLVSNYFGSSSLFIIIYMLALELQFAIIIRNKNKEEKPQRLLKFFCIFTCCRFNENDQKFIENNISNEYRSNRWIFSTYFIFERIAIAYAETVISDSNSELILEEEVEELDDNLTEVQRISAVFMAIFSLTILSILIFRPFKEKIDNRIEGIPRLLIFLMALTILLSDEEVTTAEIQLIFFLLTLVVICFWTYSLKPLTFYKAVKERSKENFGTITETQIKLQWHQIEDLESIKKLLERKKKTKIKENEWNILSPRQRILIFAHQILAAESVRISEVDIETDLKDEDKIFSLTKFNESIVDFNSINKNLERVEEFDFSCLKFSIKFFNCLNDVKIFEIASNVTILNQNQSIDIRKEHLFGLSNALRKSSIVEVNLTKSKLTDDETIGLAEVIKKSSSLKILNLRENCIRSDGFKNLLDSVTKKTTLTSLLLDKNFIEKISTECVHHQASLIRLTLTYNYFTQEELEVVILKVAENVNLRKLEVASQNDPKSIDSNYNSFLTDEINIKENFASFEPVGNWFRVKNTKIRTLETNLELKFDKFDNSVVEASTQKRKLFEFNEGVICGFKSFLWKQVKKGLCCMITTGLNLRSPKELENIKIILNEVNDKNETMLELVLKHGMSHIKYCVERLVALGANIHFRTKNGSRLFDIAREHKDEELKEWIKSLD